MDGIKKYVNWRHDYVKPSNLKRIRREEGKGGEDTSEEEDEEMKKYTCTYKQEEDFSRE